MGATWFDRDRGVGQGRCTPVGFVPPAEDYVFALGAEDLPEAATLSAGDYTQVKQAADLTGFDFVTVVADVAGAVAGHRQPLAGWAADPDDLLHFDFDFGGSPVPNLVPGGFPLAHAGDIRAAREGYSPDASYCREVPAGSLTGYLAGVNAPPAVPGILGAYTLQWWMAFDADAHASSAGVNPTVFEALVPGVGGVAVGLAGVAGPGAHQWYVYLRHVNGGVDELLPFLIGPAGVGGGLVIDASPGWHLYSVRFDVGRPWPFQAELFEDGALVATLAAPLTGPFAPPPPGAPVAYASPPLWGMVDRVRLLARWMDDLAVASAYDACVIAPPAVAYAWRVGVYVDGVPYVTRRVAADEWRRWTELRAPVRALDGVHEVAFRLSLEEV